MVDGRTPVFSRSYPFPIYHFPFRLARFSGLLEPTLTHSLQVLSVMISVMT
jgi:hypothetical protein